jgi:signal transduction histidine kinase
MFDGVIRAVKRPITRIMNDGRLQISRCLPARISTRVALVAFVGMLLGGGLSTYAAVSLVRSIERQHIEFAELRSLEIARESISLPLWNYDAQSAEAILSAFIDQRAGNIIALRVSNGEGQILYETFAKNLEHAAWETLRRDPYSTLRTGVVKHQTREIGNIEILFSQRRLVEAQSRHNFWFLSMIIASSLGVGLLMVEMTRRWLIGPLLRITRAAEVVRKGNYDTRFPENESWEFDVLNRTFNETLAEVRLRDQQLQRHNQELEALVEKRTSERDQERLHAFQASRLAALGQLSAGVAHEINNPLAIILGHAYSLKRMGNERADARLTRSAERIDKNAHRIAEIVSGLRSLSKDHGIEDAEDFPAEKLVAEVRRFASHRLQSADISFETILDATAPINGNFSKLGQALLNLIDNSIDAVTPLAHRWIRLQISNDTFYHRITITDAGSGIATELQDKIFTPFYTTKPIGQGRGLGLSMVHAIVKQHGGLLSLNKASPHTQFVIEIPRQRANEKAA